MTYIKWKDEVESYLLGLSYEEKKKVFSYFAEMYADKRDAGKSEEQIIEEFGAPYDVAQKILSDARESSETSTASTSSTAGVANTAGVAGVASTSRTAGTVSVANTAGTASTAGVANTAGADGFNKSAQPVRDEDTPPKKRRGMVKASGGKGWIVALCLAGTLLFLGLLFFLVDVARNGWKLTVTYEMQTFTASEQTEHLNLYLAAGKMDVTYYEGETVEVIYPTSNNFRYVVTESDGAVYVKPKGGFRFFMFGTGTIPTVTVRIPTEQELSLYLSVSAGDATVADGMSFTSVKLDVSAGSVTAGRIDCGTFRTELSAGSVHFTGVNCNDANFDVSAGSATVSNLTCDRIKVDVSAGTVNLNVVGVESEYAVTISKSAGKCNLTSHTGTVDGKLIDLDISAGSVTVTFID